MCDLVTRREFSPVCKTSLCFLDLCSAALQHKTKHSRGNIIENTLCHFSSLSTTGCSSQQQNDVGTCTLIRQHPSTRRKLLRTRRQIPLFDRWSNGQMVVSIFHSPTNGSDCCCINIINRELNSRCPTVGLKTMPTTTATLGRKRRTPRQQHWAESDAHQPLYV